MICAAFSSCSPENPAIDWLPTAPVSTTPLPQPARASGAMPNSPAVAVKTTTVAAARAGSFQPMRLALDAGCGFECFVGVSDLCLPRGPDVLHQRLWPG